MVIAREGECSSFHTFSGADWIESGDLGTIWVDATSKCIQYAQQEGLSTCNCEVSCEPEVLEEEKNEAIANDSNAGRVLRDICR